MSCTVFGRNFSSNFSAHLLLAVRLRCNLFLNIRLSGFVSSTLTQSGNILITKPDQHLMANHKVSHMPFSIVTAKPLRNPYIDLHTMQILLQKNSLTWVLPGCNVIGVAHVRAGFGSKVVQKFFTVAARFGNHKLPGSWAAVTPNALH